MSNLSWDVIIFKGDDESCAYVPSSWAVNSSKTVYLWPKLKSALKIQKLQDECVAPNTAITFEECAAVCKATVYDLARAKELSQELLYASNIDDSESDQDECHKKSSGSTPNVIEEAEIYCLQKGYEPECNTQISAIGSRDTRNEQDDGDIIVHTSLTKLQKGIATLQSDMIDIRKELINISTTLAVLVNTKNKIVPQEFTLRINNAEEIDSMEWRLKADDAAFADLVTTLALLNLDTVKKSVNFIMKRLMHKDISLQYSSLGKKKNLNFSSLKMCRAVFDAVRTKFPEALESDIMRAISSSLSHAGDRDGGRKLR